MRHILNNYEDRRKPLNFDDLISSVCLTAVLFITLLLLRQKRILWSLQKEVCYALKESKRQYKLLVDMLDGLNDQNNQLTQASLNLDDLNKKLDKLSLELETENIEMEMMYKCLMEWKHDWMEQSHKIRDITPEYLEQLPKISNNNVDRAIEVQRYEVRIIVCCAKKRLEKFKKFPRENPTFIKKLKTLYVLRVYSMLYCLLTLVVLNEVTTRMPEE